MVQMKWNRDYDSVIISKWNKVGGGGNLEKKLKAIYLWGDVMSGKQAPYFAIPNEM